MGKYQELIERVRRENAEHAAHLEKVQRLFDGARQYVVKQTSALSHLILGYLARGPQNPQSKEESAGLTEAELSGICAHVNLVGDPGTGKTVLGSVLAWLSGGKFERVQGQTNVEPTDIIGQEKPLSSGESYFSPGPVFANILLADEINRMKQATQSALLQAMAEGEVTRDIILADEGKKKRTIRLPRPFYVLSTQNPIEQEGVYDLPEAQLDRFAMQIVMTGIAVKDGMEVIERNQHVYGTQLVEPVSTPEEILEIRQFIHDAVYVSPLMSRYAVRLAKAVLPYNDLPKGEEEKDAEYLRAVGRIHAEPLCIGERAYHLRELVKGAMYVRMAIVMVAIAKVQAFLQGRLYVLPEDIRKVFLPASRHRLFLHARAEGLIQKHGLTPEGRRLDHIELVDLMLVHVRDRMSVPLKGPGDA